ncbi:hypothetical protein F2Q68_00027534 [Brassica cretica]|uniref:indole-3-acetaldehyde oxidase n=1 Tax=Brassica cretica TaxID=69181 RepID=A0A8S9IFC6_BRACR|nr:hypothetical protein F2Q68_00027534 [Brassica cretica]
MCISLYSALSNSSGGGLTVSEAERSIAGNLCRCTGYRPIVDACKSFAADVDIEDLGLNSFWKKGDSKEAMLKSLPPYNPKEHLVTTFPEFLKNVHNGLGYRWTTPCSVTELRTIMESANAGDSLKLVVGNTGTGYYKDDEGRFDRYVDISRVPEMLTIKRDENGIEIGASVTISNVIDALKESNFKKMAAHMEKIGNRSIRNSASIGGNLVMAQSRKFPSDIATLLLAADASVHVLNGGKIEKAKLHEFLDSPPMVDSRRVLLKVEIPAWTDDAELLFETYRAAPRSIGNALPYVSAAFFARVSHQMVDECLLAFGSYGGDRSIRATEVERFLTGKSLSYRVLHEAMGLLRGIIAPGKDTSHPEYRKALAVGFLFEFFYPLIDNNGRSNGHVDPTESLLPFLSSSQQVVESDEFHFQPVGEAVVKVGAALQASGEAVFVDDIPTLPDCLHGAFIYSTEPLAKIKSISFSGNLTPTGVFAVLTFKDIPIQGQNIGSKTVFGPGPLFADELTRCAGQRIALVVADTQKHADRAAKLAVVEYDTNNLEEPILTVEDAVKRSSFFDVHPMFYPEPVGDVLEGMKEADRKILLAEFRLGSQYFFYMEPQTALALPDEDNCVKVFSSSQAPDTEPLAKIKSISFSGNLTPTGVFAVLTFKDIPIQGQNIGSKTVFGPGPLFADELTRCAGQRIALVVADTQKHADRAAKLAVVEYDTNNLEEPILTVEDAVKRSSFFDVHPMFYPEPVGDVLEGMKEADRKILLAEFRLGSQYFFYMEPQTALALPDEDNCVKVFSSSQAPEYVHSVIATCLGIPEHNVRVITRRVGGGFGGKAIKSMPVATACALAAHKLHRPVKIYLNRKTDMIMAGGRHPMKVTYNVGFGSDGKVTALELTMLIDAGTEPDVSPILPRNIMGPLRKYDWGALSFDVEVDVLTGKTEILRSDIIYDCGKSLNPAVDLGQVEGAFVQGIGFFMMEEYTTDEKGLVVQQGTWDYKIPTVDTIPKQEARKQSLSWNCNGDVSCTDFELPVPATMPVVKGLCGLYSVEKYLEGKICGK